MRKLIGTLLVLLPVVAIAQSGIDGKWRIDVNKAKMDSKPMVYEVKDGMYSCSTCDPKVRIKADGSDQTVTGSPYVNSEKVKIVNDSTVERVGSKDGKVTFRATYTVSPDGKTLSEKYEGHPAGSDQEVTGSSMYSRVGEPVAGSHALSGSWKMEKWESVSNNALTFAYTSTGDGLNYKASTGESYTAKFDGKDYPYKGDPGTTAVVLKKVDDHTFEETYKRGSEVVGAARMTISPDGKLLTMLTQDKRRGTSDTWVAEKQEKTVADK